MPQTVTTAHDTTTSDRPAGLIRKREEAEDRLYPGAFLACCHCRAEYDRGDLDELDDDGVCLRCLECGESGYIVREPRDRQRAAPRRMEGRLPAPLSRNYYPKPRDLLAQRQALGIGAHELLVIDALWSHSFDAGSVIRPSIARLVDLTGLSESSVKRSLRRLREAGLLEVERERLHGKWRTKQYDLSPLWARLAELVTTGHTDPQPQVTQTPEVEEVTKKETQDAEASCTASAASESPLFVSDEDPAPSWKLRAVPDGQGDDTMWSGVWNGASSVA